jgi:hypothetical protein
MGKEQRQYYETGRDRDYTVNKRGWCVWYGVAQNEIWAKTGEMRPEKRLWKGQKEEMRNKDLKKYKQVKQMRKWKKKGLWKK